jgi:hypothetical protein
LAQSHGLALSRFPLSWLLFLCQAQVSFTIPQASAFLATTLFVLSCVGLDGRRSFISFGPSLFFAYKPGLQSPIQKKKKKRKHA